MVSGMSELVIKGVPPAGVLVDAIYVAAETLGIWEVFVLDGRYHFPVGSGWSVALSADSANRIRVEACWLTRPEARMWTFAHRMDRLAGLVKRMSAVPEAV
jgi:hypothetical protein